MNRRKVYVLITMITLSLLLLASPLQIAGHTLHAAAYASSAEESTDAAVMSRRDAGRFSELTSRIAGVYKLKRFRDVEDLECSGTVRFEPNGRFSFDIEIIPLDKSEGPYLVQIEGNYKVTEDYIKLKVTKRGGKDNSYSDPNDGDAFPDFFFYSISDRDMILTNKEQSEDGEMKELQFFYEKIG